MIVGIHSCVNIRPCAALVANRESTYQSKQGLTESSVFYQAEKTLLPLQTHKMCGFVKKKKSDPFAKKIPKTTKAIVLNADHIVSILKMVFNNGANFK